MTSNQYDKKMKEFNVTICITKEGTSKVWYDR